MVMPFVDRVWLSADDQVGNDRLLLEVAAPTPVVSNQRYDRTSKITIADDWIPITGTYHLILELNSPPVTEQEADRTNNVRAIAAEIRKAPRPDLVIAAATAPNRVLTDRDFDATFSVRNRGEIAATGPWVDRVLLSTDGTLGDDVVLGSFAYGGRINPGQTVERTQVLRIPSASVPRDGIYYLIFVSDADRAIRELSDDNNTRVVPIEVKRPPLPDLKVASITAPAEAFSGTTTEVQWVVENSGIASTDAEEWHDYVFLSLDDTPSGEDLLKLPVRNVSYLDVGERYVATATVSIPRGISGQYRLIVYTDGYDPSPAGNPVVVTPRPNAVNEQDEANNWATSRSILVRLSPYPDLQVPLVVAPENAFAGGSMAVRWRVTNKGTGSVPPAERAWDDAVYLSRNETLDATDRRLRTVARTGNLAVNGTYERDVRVDLPKDIAGAYYVIVRTDDENRVFEFAFEGNNEGFDATPVQISATPPDLVVSIESAPNTIKGNEPFGVSWKVLNQGAFTANAGWFDSVYLSSDETLDPQTDLLLGSFFNGRNLDGGEHYVRTEMLQTPVCGSGSYRLYVVTDATNTVFEFDPTADAEKNNTSTPHVALLEENGSDLEIVETTATPTAAAVGQPLNVSLRVRNNGPGATNSASWVDSIYLRPVNGVGEGSILLGSIARNGALRASESYSAIGSFTIPSTVEGTYQVVFITDANDQVTECLKEGNNSSAGPVVEISNRTPDLRPNPIVVDTRVKVTQSLEVTWGGRNVGETEVRTIAWTDGIYLSEDADLDPADRRLGQAIIRGPLGISASYDAGATVQMPYVEPGNYFLLVRVDDSGSVFEGLLENNNVRAIAIRVVNPDVDLTVASVVVPSEAVSGQDLQVSWQVRNSGTESTLQSGWTDYIILSRDLIADPSDPILGWRPRQPGLVAGESYTASQTVALPQGLTGPYFVYVRTDWNNVVGESNEDNNWGGPASTTIVLPPPVDLIVTSVLPPSTALMGEPARFTYTVRNQGLNTANGRWVDALYLSPDDKWDITDELIGRVERAGPLAPNAEYTAELNADVPPVDPGRYRVLVRADVRNRVRESSERNNLGVSSGISMVDAEELTLGQVREFTPRPGALKHFRVQVPAGETLEHSAFSSNVDDWLDLFVRRQRPARESAFDIASSDPFASKQSLLLPTTTAGAYYSATASRFTSLGSLFELKAVLVPFGPRQVLPTEIGDTGFVTVTIVGGALTDVVRVRLVGPATFTTNDVKIVDATKLMARFRMVAAPHGVYSLQVENANGKAASLADAVTVTLATVPSVDIIRSPVGEPVIGRSYSIPAIIRNTSNIDLPYVSLRVYASALMNLKLEGPADFLLGGESSAGSLDVAEGTEMNGTARAVCFLRDVPVGAAIGLRVKVSEFPRQPFLVRFDAQVDYLPEIVQRFRDNTESFRRFVVQHPKSVDGQIARLAHNRTAFHDDAVSAIVASGLFRQDDFADEPRMRSFTSFLPDPCKCDDPDVYIPRCLRKYGILLWSACVMLENTKCFTLAFDGASGGCGCQQNPSACEQPRNPVDPNEKSSPIGFSSTRSLSVTPIHYRVDFENVTTAQAAAARVEITDDLDSSLDWRTFRLQEIAFGEIRIPVPANRAFFQDRIQLPESMGSLLADITAGIDIRTGRIRVSLQAIDPNTGEPPTSANLGLLPPEDGTKRGQGYFTYTVRPRASTPTGTVIRNKASIVFDTEEPIVTNEVFNTIDAGAPSSQVLELPPRVSTPTFAVSWSGQDDANGSGVAGYDIYVSINGGAFSPWLLNRTETTAEFEGQEGNVYAFYSVARDHVGNIESAPTGADTTVAVGDPRPVITSLAPPNASVNGPAFTLTVRGTGFAADAVVEWNGSPRPTTFVNRNELRANIRTADLRQERTVQITVRRPTANGLSEPSNYVVGRPAIVATIISIVRTSNGTIASVRLANNGSSTAQFLRITQGTLGTATMANGMPVGLGGVSPGSSRETRLRFVNPGTPGTAATLRLTVTFVGGGQTIEVPVVLP
jgi:subtilase family serine protease